MPGSDAHSTSASTREAPFAEQLRHEDLRTENDAATYRTSLWQGQIDEAAVVDDRTFEKAEAAGFLLREALVDDDYERCQAEATWLMSHGVTAVVSPCAALPGSSNITIFGPRVQALWGTERRLTLLRCPSSDSRRVPLLWALRRASATSATSMRIWPRTSTRSRPEAGSLEGSERRSREQRSELTGRWVNAGSTGCPQMAVRRESRRPRFGIAAPPRRVSVNGRNWPP